MLPSTARNIPCDTDIKGAITLAGEDVDARTLLTHTAIDRPLFMPGAGSGSPLSRGRRKFVVPSERGYRSEMYANLRNQVLGGFQGDILIGRRVWEARDQTEPGFPDPRSDAVDEGQLPDRRVDRALVNNLLHLVEDRLALCAVQLARLLLIKFIEVRVAAINKCAALDDVRFKTCRGIPESAGTHLDDV